MSWHTWQAPTYRAEVGHDRPVACPQCRRPVAPDMLLPTAALPAGARARLRRPEAAWACDSCRATLHREGHVSRHAYAEALGAPAAVVRALQAKHDRRTHPSPEG